MRGHPTNQPGQSLKDLRAELKLSLRDLQDLTGVNRSIWSLIESGAMLPSPEQIAVLSRVLRVPYEEWRIRFVLERRASA